MDVPRDGAPWRRRLRAVERCNVGDDVRVQADRDRRHLFGVDPGQLNRDLRPLVPIERGVVGRREPVPFLADPAASVAAEPAVLLAGNVSAVVGAQRRLPKIDREAEDVDTREFS